jgi:hypothetical protein
MFGLPFTLQQQLGANASLFPLHPKEKTASISFVSWK